MSTNPKTTKARRSELSYNISFLRNAKRSAHPPHKHGAESRYKPQRASAAQNAAQSLPHA
jgi:hypothetical protein